MKKTYSKTAKKCKVTFTYPQKNARSVFVAGDFNNWDTSALPMKKGKTGFTATVELDPDQDYQYRFWVDDAHWENDSAADDYISSPYPDAENCVVRTNAS